MPAARIVLTALALAAAATLPAAGSVSVNVFGLRAPEEVGGFTLNDSTNFEKQRPGEGYGLDYSQPGWKLDVYVYDLKRAAIPEDVKSAIVRAEFERSRADVFMAQPRGPYAQVYLRRNFTMEDSAKRTRFQCAAFHLTRDGAKPQDGFMCVTSWNNKFVKLRLTTLSGADTEAGARKHVMSWIPVLWGGAARAQQAAPAAKAKAKASAKQIRRAQPQVKRAPQRPGFCPPGQICR
ncbi:MAG: hypothetical protein FJX62_05685 [Alphaproteobacteria bacterium]|nr:hypothetical protein [Alphaproteobacteria bacterium]